MHSCAEKNADEFWLTVQGQVAESKLDFRGYVFPADVSLADFGDDPFTGDADFNRATFSGDAYFGEATLSGDAYFNEASFSGTADFGEASFSGTADFGEASFSGTAYFNGATFSGDAYFNRATFSGTAYFYGANFSGETSFERANFSGETSFERANFSIGTTFDAPCFSGSTSFRSTDLEHVTFRSVNLSKCSFAEARNLEKAEFDHVEWAHWPPDSIAGLRSGVLRRRLAVADEVLARSHHRAPDDLESSSGRVSTVESVERIYRGLRASYEARRDHPRVGGFYFAEMEMRRLAHKRFGRTIGSLTAWYGLVSGYGERWGRALGWFLVVWLISAVLYDGAGLLLKVTQLGTGDVIQTIGKPARLIPDALIHSFLVATLIGKDTYAVPATWFGQLVQSVELIVGPLLLGLMGLAIRRRFQR